MIIDTENMTREQLVDLVARMAEHINWHNPDGSLRSDVAPLLGNKLKAT